MILFQGVFDGAEAKGRVVSDPVNARALLSVTGTFVSASESMDWLSGSAFRCNEGGRSARASQIRSVHLQRGPTIRNPLVTWFIAVMSAMVLLANATVGRVKDDADAKSKLHYCFAWYASKPKADSNERRTAEIGEVEFG